MAKCRIGKYNGNALKTMEKVMEDKRSWTINEVYKNSEYGFHWYMNKNGYLHILKPCAVRLDEIVSYYAISDLLLTTDNMLKENGNYGRYDTILDAYQAIGRQ